METELIKKRREEEIRTRLISLRIQGLKTSKGEAISMSSIGRTLDPPVNRVTVYYVIAGRTKSRRVQAAIEKELGRQYWSKKHS